jgi:hypothetical protein
VDTAAATGGGRGRQRRAAKAVAEGEEQCQNDVWCVLYSTLLGKAKQIQIVYTCHQATTIAVIYIVR